jgi:hypothetical protein
MLCARTLLRRAVRSSTAARSFATASTSTPAAAATTSSPTTAAARAKSTYTGGFDPFNQGRRILITGGTGQIGACLSPVALRMVL